jgi:acetolactate synthase-1/2/3 large subunit
MGRTLGWPPNALSINHPHDWVGELHGAGVGAGPGIAVGAALALRDMGSPRIPVMVCGDGEFTMGCNALWTAAHERIPLLLIVANNRSYFNDELHQATVARVRGRPQQNAWIGQRIEDPAPDIAAIGRGFGLDGAGPVEKLEDLAGAL